MPVKRRTVTLLLYEHWGVVCGVGRFFHPLISRCLREVLSPHQNVLGGESAPQRGIFKAPLPSLLHLRRR